MCHCTNEPLRGFHSSLSLHEPTKEHGRSDQLTIQPVVSFLPLTTTRDDNASVSKTRHHSHGHSVLSLTRVYLQVVLLGLFF